MRSASCSRSRSATAASVGACTTSTFATVGGRCAPSSATRPRPTWMRCGAEPVTSMIVGGASVTGNPLGARRRGGAAVGDAGGGARAAGSASRAVAQSAISSAMRSRGRREVSQLRSASRSYSGARAATSAVQASTPPRERPGASRRAGRRRPPRDSVSSTTGRPASCCCVAGSSTAPPPSETTACCSSAAATASRSQRAELRLAVLGEDLRDRAVRLDDEAVGVDERQHRAGGRPAGRARLLPARRRADEHDDGRRARRSAAPGAAGRDAQLRPSETTVVSASGIAAR